MMPSLHIVIVCLRWVTLVLSTIVVLKSFRGFLRFGQGDQWPSTFIRSLAFLYALSAGLLQSGYLLEGIPAPEPVARLAVSLGLNVMAALFAVWGLFAMNKHPIGKMRPVYMHVDEAMAIALLAEVNPKAALRLAHEARLLTADCVVHGRCDSE